MKPVSLSYDPYNLIITGVGGQGSVLASRIVGDMLSSLNFHVTIGETFGASQRGGSVMSHLRISGCMAFSPQIPRGRAHAVVALEPTEALRVLRDYGNPEVRVVCNTRPIYPIGVICGEQSYPRLHDLEAWIAELSARAWFIDTIDAAMKLGSPIFGNVMAVGALSATRVLPLSREGFEKTITARMSPEKVAVNLEAFDAGVRMLNVRAIC
jgi:indolepyruvate ferredoxin oxidoreductase beta subunit